LQEAVRQVCSTPWFSFDRHIDKPACVSTGRQRIAIKNTDACGPFFREYIARPAVSARTTNIEILCHVLQTHFVEKAR
jgi:hypothetical protein